MPLMWNSTLYCRKNIPNFLAIGVLLTTDFSAADADPIKVVGVTCSARKAIHG